MVPSSGEDGGDGGDGDAGDAGDASGDDGPSICCSLKSVLGTRILP